MNARRFSVGMIEMASLSSWESGTGRFPEPTKPVTFGTCRIISQFSSFISISTRM